MFHRSKRNIFPTNQPVRWSVSTEDKSFSSYKTSQLIDRFQFEMVWQKNNKTDAHHLSNATHVSHEDSSRKAEKGLSSLSLSSLLILQQSYLQFC